MTAVEKAKELVEIYAETIEPIQYEVLLERNWNNAKQCALIAVDDIIKETKLHDKTIYQHGRTFYWQEVKQEIEKI